MLKVDLLPWIEAVSELGDDVLEVGPGPGLTTDLLRERVARVTAVELDPDLAAALAERLAGTNVEVIHGDASDTGLQSDRFTTATCFSMLHHIPASETQDRLFAEMHRVLRRGGTFLGIDGVDNEAIREFHVDDVFNPVDLATFPARLESFGFTYVKTESDASGLQFRFRATKP